MVTDVVVMRVVVIAVVVPAAVIGGNGGPYDSDADAPDSSTGSQ